MKRNRRKRAREENKDRKTMKNSTISPNDNEQQLSSPEEETDTNDTEVVFNFDKKGNLQNLDLPKRNKL